MRLNGTEGVWITQEDPIGVAGGVNLYGYGAGDPVNFSDPFGLCAKYLRNSEGLCPGALSVTQWRAVESAANTRLRQESRGLTLEALRDGRIHAAAMAIAGSTTFDGHVTVSTATNPRSASAYRGDVFQNQEALAKTLAHEMKHVLQFRAMSASGLTIDGWESYQSNATARDAHEAEATIYARQQYRKP